MSRPTPAEDRRENTAMGHAAVAGESNISDFVIKRPAIVDGKEVLRQQEFDLMEMARSRAKKAGLVAYRRSYREGSYAVPSTSEMGLVHDTDLNWHTGQPISCSCPSYARWCLHMGAARLLWEQQKDMTDADYTELTRQALKEMETEHGIEH